MPRSNTDIADVCVIGSGFGGGVAALRFAEAGQRVIVLEKGDRWDGRAESRQFQQTQGDFKYWTDMFNIYPGTDVGEHGISVVLGGKGLGGGSLTYSNVSLRAPSIVFDDRTAVWPEEVNRAALDPYYEIAENQLGVTQFQWAGDSPADDWKVASKKDGAFARACQNVGVSCDPVPSTINEQCGNLGWCNAGCVRGAKNSIDRMYLQPAEDLGAIIKVGADASHVKPRTSRLRWEVAYRQKGSAVPRKVLAQSVVIAAGAVGSPAVLLRSAKDLPNGLSTHVGRNLSRGGDMILLGVLPDDVSDLELPGSLETYKGKVIGVCSFHYAFEPPRGFGPGWPPFIMQPMMVLPVMTAAFVSDPDGKTKYGDMRTFGVGPKHYLRRYGDRLLQVGIMGRDGMDGQVRLGPGGVPVVTIRNSPATKRLWDAARAGFAHIIEDGAGGTVLPTVDQVSDFNVTIHPLGTCRMSPSADEGVLRHDCTVWQGSGDGVYEGLHVMDASVFSSPVIVNGSLTIAACAEYACDRILNG